MSNSCTWWYWWFTKCKFNNCNCWYIICNWSLYSSNWYYNWNRFLSSYFKYNSTKQITVAKSAADTLLNGQQIHDMGPWVAVGSATTTAGITTFTTTVDHGLAVGNQI